MSTTLITLPPEVTDSIVNILSYLTDSKDAAVRKTNRQHLGCLARVHPALTSVAQKRLYRSLKLSLNQGDVKALKTLFEIAESYERVGELLAGTEELQLMGWNQAPDGEGLLVQQHRELVLFPSVTNIKLAYCDLQMEWLGEEQVTRS